MNLDTFTIHCTGDAVAGDVVLFTEAVWSGGRRNPKYLGDRRIAARILRDSYGAVKQQHTFVLQVLHSDGIQPVEVGMEIKRKGRNVYRKGTMRQPWPNEQERIAAADEKHRRGKEARRYREARLAGTPVS